MFLWLQTGVFVAATLLSPSKQLTPNSYPEKWVGVGQGNTYVLYRTYNTKAMAQGSVGSCVGCAGAKCLEMMTGKKFSAEWLYGSSRKCFDKTIGAGSNCAWLAHSMMEIGGVQSGHYPILGFNLSMYDPALAYSWERGPPESLEWVAARSRTSGYVKITTWEQLRDSIANGHPVIVGSSVGFGAKDNARRDSTGMLHSRWWSRWGHAMVVCGASDGDSKRVLLLNSWGSSWVSGPKWLGDEPDGSFWITKQDAEKILSYGDSYALLPFVGSK